MELDTVNVVTGEIQELLPGFDVPVPEPLYYRVQLTVVRTRDVLAVSPEAAVARFLELDADGETVTTKRTLAATLKV